MKRAFALSVAILTGITLIIMVSLSGCPGGEEGQLPDEQSLALLTEEERAAFEKVNAYRQSKGLAPLEINDQITREARKHSQNMADGTVPFSHQGFEERITATKIRYQSAAENVAYNKGSSDPADTAVTGWIGSEGHRQNIEGGFNITGMGVAVNSAGVHYFTQIFMKADQGTNVAPQSTEPSDPPKRPWWLRWIR